MIQLQNEQFTNKTLDERECSAECSQKLFTGKYLCRIICEPKSLIYPCSLHLHYINDSSTQLFFSGFCRIFKNTFPLEHSWASASDFIFDIFKSNKYMSICELHKYVRNTQICEFSINHFLQKKGL